eukprot:4575316-Karenia_brevis.AAC.1
MCIRDRCKVFSGARLAPHDLMRASPKNYGDHVLSKHGLHTRITLASRNSRQAPLDAGTPDDSGQDILTGEFSVTSALPMT